MTKNIKLRALIIAAVIGVSVYGFIPPDKKVKLGLDLKGGVHLVLRVNTEDALKATTDLDAERLRESLDKDSIRYTKIEGTSPTSFHVEGLQDVASLRAKATEAGIDTDFDQTPGAGGSEWIVYRVTDVTVPQVDAASDELKKLKDTLQRGLADEQVAQYVTKIESEIGTTINQAAFAQVTGANN